MKPARRWNERTRSILTLELAVVLPAAALIIVSILHLKSIQRDRAVEALIQRDFTHVLAIAEKHMNGKAFDLLDDVRRELPSPGEACNVTLDRILSTHPYVLHAFMYDPQNGMVFRSQPDRLPDASVRAEADGLSKMFEAWFKIEFVDLVTKIAEKQKKGIPPYIFENNWAARGDKHVYEIYALFIKDEHEGQRKALAGVVIDPDYLREEFFPEMLETVMSHSLTESQGQRNQAVMMVHPKSESAPLAASAGWDGGVPEVERNMETAFPGLALAIKLPGTTVQAIGQRFVRSSYLVLSGLSLLLLGGLILTYRNVSKEVALARLKSDFVSNVSHELRTPLALIRLYAETLEMGRLNSQEKHQQYYQIIRKESERLSALINNILDFSRIEAGRKEYDFRETDLCELVRNTLDSYRYQIEEQGFVLEQKIEAVPPLRVDREAMARSLVNLVNNALKYSADRKYLEVNLYRKDGSVTLEVIDHGIGIPRQEQSKIFEKFYRVGDPLVHNTKGSGLGLSLVRHIVQAHGGQVTVDSVPGRGSKFTIALPLNTAAEGNTTTASA